jgi:hypothetical protein
VRSRETGDGRRGEGGGRTTRPRDYETTGRESQAGLAPLREGRVPGVGVDHFSPEIPLSFCSPELESAVEWAALQDRFEAVRIGDGGYCAWGSFEFLLERWRLWRAFWCRPDNALLRTGLSTSLTVQNGLARDFRGGFLGVSRVIEAGRTVKDRGGKDEGCGRARADGVLECGGKRLNIPHKNVGAANCYPGLRRRLGGMGRWLRGGNRESAVVDQRAAEIPEQTLVRCSDRIMAGQNHTHIFHDSVLP